MIPLNGSAVDLFVNSFAPGEKVLILGGTGWFGRTALAMLRNVEVESYVVAGHPREFVVDGDVYPAQTWDEANIRAFEPDIVLDFAYLTVDKASLLGLKTYEDLNQKLRNRLSVAIGLPSVRRVLSVSSGASVLLPRSMRGDPAAQSYAAGKREIEGMLREVSRSRGVTVSVARAWSVSGGHVQYPGQYAFSGMIFEGLKSGVIPITSEHLVFRRYSAVEELLALSVPKVEGPAFTLLDSAGTLIELEELAQVISAAIPRSRVVSNLRRHQIEIRDEYCADAVQWDAASQASGLQQLPIASQVSNVVSALKV